MNKTVICLVGHKASGKGEVVNFLSKKGFKDYSLSDEVKEEATKRGLDQKVELWQKLGSELREKYGNDILAVRVLEKIRQNGGDNVVIEGIRHPAELLYFKRKLKVFILGVSAPQNRRLKWFLKRNRGSDPKNKEDFYRVDKRDLGEDSNRHGQQVASCLKLADFIIDNNGTLKELRRKVKNVFNQMILNPVTRKLYLGR